MLFEFYWSWYEEYCPKLFEGDDKTQEEWKSDCQKAMIESFDEYINNVPYGWASLHHWMELAYKKLEEYGYKPASPVKFGYFGCYLPKEDDEREEYEDMPELSEQIKKMQKYNTAFEKKMDEEDKLTDIALEW